MMVPPAYDAHLQFGDVVVSVAVLAISALTDLAYAWVDPRLRRAAQGGAG